MSQGTEHYMTNTLHDDDKAVKLIKPKRKPTRQEMSADHRKIAKAAYKKRAAPAQSRTAYKATANKIHLISHLIYITYQGTQDGITTYQEMADKISQLNDQYHKPISPYTIRDWLQDLKKTAWKGHQLIKVTSPRKMKIDYVTDQKVYTNIGLKIHILDINNIGSYLFNLLSCYDQMLNPGREIEVTNLKIQEKLIRLMGERFRRLVVDNSTSRGTIPSSEGNDSVVWGEQIRSLGGTNPSLLINTLNTVNTKNITAVPAVTFSVSVDKSSVEEPRRKSTIVYDRPVSDGLKTASGLFGGLEQREKPAYVWEEDEVLVVQESEIEGRYVEAVNVMLEKYAEDFEPLRSDYRLYRQAARELAASAQEMAHGVSDVSKSQIMGMAKHVIEDYLRKVKIYGHNEVPVYWDQLPRENSPSPESEAQRKTDALANLEKIKEEMNISKKTAPEYPVKPPQIPAQPFFDVGSMDVADFERKLKIKNKEAKKRLGIDDG